MNSVSNNRSVRANISRSVIVHSDQTTKKYGEIVRVENDRIWGPQYLIAVPEPDMGEELFWMRRHEISFKQ
jgi:hypothetical protein